MEAIYRQVEVYPPLFLVSGAASMLLVTTVLTVVVVIASRRRRTKRLLESCGLPTVMWRPRFVNYTPSEHRRCAGRDQQKLPSSSITGILPRMKRLGGPFGMYGTVYGISTPVVHVAHPIPARNILMGTSTSSDMTRRPSISQSTGATKSPAYDHFKNFSGNGVFTADGEDWKEKRASVVHCLLRGVSNPKSEASLQLERESNRAADSVMAELDRRSKGSRVDNLVPILQKATIGLIYRYITHDCVGEGEVSCDSDTISEVSGFKSASSSSSSLSSLMSPAASSLSHETSKPVEICSPSMLQTYLTSVTDIRMIILAQSRSIWFVLPRWVYRSCSAMYEDEERTMVPIRNFSQRACARAKPGSPLALLRERSSHRCEVSKKLELPNTMLDEAITLLFAGQDTSAATLSWTLHLLSLHLDVQTSLAEEINSVLDSHAGTVEYDGSLPRLTKKLVSQMPLLDAVIKESMRLYPVAPFVVRRLGQNIKVQDEANETVLPKQAFACIWIFGLHRNPDLWHRPDDFVPGRWIDSDLREQDDGQNMTGAYMPFAAGPRNCLGQPLAQVILRIILARLVYANEFRDEQLSTCGQVGTDSERRGLRKDMQAGFTVLPSGGLPFLIRKRNRDTTKLESHE